MMQVLHCSLISASMHTLLVMFWFMFSITVLCRMCVCVCVCGVCSQIVNNNCVVLFIASINHTQGALIAVRAEQHAALAVTTMFPAKGWKNTQER